MLAWPDRPARPLGRLAEGGAACGRRRGRGAQYQTSPAATFARFLAG